MTTDIGSPSLGERPELISNSHQLNTQKEISISSIGQDASADSYKFSPLSGPDPLPALDSGTSPPALEKPKDFAEAGYTSGSNSDSAGKSVIFKKPKPITSTSINKVFLNKVVASSSSLQSQPSTLKKSGTQISSPKSSSTVPASTSSWGSSAKSRLATKISGSQAGKRENSSSPKPLENRPGVAKGSSTLDSVWNRPKAAEEIDMSTIHMAARLESRDRDTAGWDEIDDDDDDWGDTIDFGDGTKITISHDEPPSSDQTLPAKSDVVSQATSVSTKPSLSPWKHVSVPEPTPISPQAPTYHVPHSERFSQDIFDRSWRAKGPSTVNRSIFNANTGKLEQVDEGSLKLRNRLPSRASTRDFPPRNRIPSDSNVSERGFRDGRRASSASSRHADELLPLKPSPTASHAVPSLDQSLVEPSIDIEAIQNSIMLDTRERAKKRKEEEMAAESARIERTKQKAEELARKTEAAKESELERERLEKERVLKSVSPRKGLPPRLAVAIPSETVEIQPDEDSPRKRAAAFLATAAKTKLVNASKADSSLPSPSLSWRNPCNAGRGGRTDATLQGQKSISSPPLSHKPSVSSLDEVQQSPDIRKGPELPNSRKLRLEKPQYAANAWNTYASTVLREEQLAKERAVQQDRKDSESDVKSPNQPRLQSNWRKVHISDTGERSYGESVVKIIDSKKESPVKDEHLSFGPSSRSTSRYFPSESAKSAISAHLRLDMKRRPSKTADEHPQDPATKTELVSSSLSTVVKLPLADREGTLTPPSSPSRILHGSPRYAPPSISSFTSAMERIKEHLHGRPASPKLRAPSPENSTNQTTVSPALTFSSSNNIAINMPLIRLPSPSESNEYGLENSYIEIDFPVEEAVVNIPRDARQFQVSRSGVGHPIEFMDFQPHSRSEFSLNVSGIANHFLVHIPGMSKPISIHNPRIQAFKKPYSSKRRGRKGFNRADDGPWRKQNPIGSLN